MSTRKFTIPKKTASTELLQELDQNSRQYRDLASNIEHSLWNSKCGLKINKVEIVNNQELFSEYTKKKLVMQKEDSRSNKEVVDIYGYRYVDSYKQAKEMCRAGLSSTSYSLSKSTCLGDPQFGVYLSRCADVMYRGPPRTGVRYLMVVFSVIKGRIKIVAEQHAVGKDQVLMEPTPDFDGHFSKEFRKMVKTPRPNLHARIFDNCQMFLYEFDLNSSDLYAKRPRQCLPYAVVHFTFVPPPVVEKPVIEPQVKVVASKLVENEPQLPAKTNLKDTSAVGDLGSKGQEEGKVLWAGKLYNRSTRMTDVKIVCYSAEPVNLPLLSDILAFRMKMEISHLKKYLPINLFKSTPFKSKVSKALLDGREFLHAEIYPVNKRSTSFARLQRCLITRQEALKIKLHDEYDLFIFPTSDLSKHLGITEDGYPAVLHLLFTSKTSDLNNLRDSCTDFFKNARTIYCSKILELEKLKLTTPTENPPPIIDIDSESVSPFGRYDDYEDSNDVPIYFTDTEKIAVRIGLNRMRKAAKEKTLMSVQKPCSLPCSSSKEAVPTKVRQPTIPAKGPIPILPVPAPLISVPTKNSTPIVEGKDSPVLPTKPLIQEKEALHPVDPRLSGRSRYPQAPRSSHRQPTRPDKATSVEARKGSSLYDKRSSPSVDARNKPSSLFKAPIRREMMELLNKSLPKIDVNTADRPTPLMEVKLPSWSPGDAPSTPKTSEKNSIDTKYSKNSNLPHQGHERKTRTEQQEFTEATPEHLSRYEISQPPQGNVQTLPKSKVTDPRISGRPAKDTPVMSSAPRVTSIASVPMEVPCVSNLAVTSSVPSMPQYLVSNPVPSSLRMASIASVSTQLSYMPTPGVTSSVLSMPQFAGDHCVSGSLCLTSIPSVSAQAPYVLTSSVTSLLHSMPQLSSPSPSSLRAANIATVSTTVPYISTPSVTSSIPSMSNYSKDKSVVCITTVSIQVPYPTTLLVTSSVHSLPHVSRHSSVLGLPCSSVIPYADMQAHCVSTRSVTSSVLSKPHISKENPVPDLTNVPSIQAISTQSPEKPSVAVTTSVHCIPHSSKDTDVPSRLPVTTMQTICASEPDTTTATVAPSVTIAQLYTESTSVSSTLHGANIQSVSTQGSDLTSTATIRPMQNDVPVIKDTHVLDTPPVANKSIPTQESSIPTITSVRSLLSPMHVTNSGVNTAVNTTGRPTPLMEVKLPSWSHYAPSTPKWLEKKSTETKSSKHSNLPEQGNERKITTVSNTPLSVANIQPVSIQGSSIPTITTIRHDQNDMNDRNDDPMLVTPPPVANLQSYSTQGSFIPTITSMRPSPSSPHAWDIAATPDASLLSIPTAPAQIPNMPNMTNFPTVPNTAFMNTILLMQRFTGLPLMARAQTMPMVPPMRNMQPVRNRLPMPAALHVASTPPQPPIPGLTYLQPEEPAALSKSKTCKHNGIVLTPMKNTQSGSSISRVTVKQSAPLAMIKPSSLPVKSILSVSNTPPLPDFEEQSFENIPFISDGTSDFSDERESNTGENDKAKRREKSVLNDSISTQSRLSKQQTAASNDLPSDYMDKKDSSCKETASLHQSLEIESSKGNVASDGRPFAPKQDKEPAMKYLPHKAKDINSNKVAEGCVSTGAAEKAKRTAGSSTSISVSQVVPSKRPHEDSVQISTAKRQRWDFQSPIETEPPSDLIHEEQSSKEKSSSIVQSLISEETSIQEEKLLPKSRDDEIDRVDEDRVITKSVDKNENLDKIDEHESKSRNIEDDEDEDENDDIDDDTDQREDSMPSGIDGRIEQKSNESSMSTSMDDEIDSDEDENENDENDNNKNENDENDNDKSENDENDKPLSEVTDGEVAEVIDQEESMMEINEESINADDNKESTLSTASVVINREVINPKKAIVEKIRNHDQLSSVENIFESQDREESIRGSLVHDTLNKKNTSSPVIDTFEENDSAKNPPCPVPLLPEVEDISDAEEQAENEISLLEYRLQRLDTERTETSTENEEEHIILEPISNEASPVRNNEEPSEDSIGNLYPEYRNGELYYGLEASNQPGFKEFDCITDEEEGGGNQVEASSKGRCDSDTIYSIFDFQSNAEDTREEKGDTNERSKDNNSYKNFNVDEDSAKRLPTKTQRSGIKHDNQSLINLPVSDLREKLNNLHGDSGNTNTMKSGIRQQVTGEADSRDSSSMLESVVGLQSRPASDDSEASDNEESADILKSTGRQEPSEEGELLREELTAEENIEYLSIAETPFSDLESIEDDSFQRKKDVPADLRHLLNRKSDNPRSLSRGSNLDHDKPKEKEEDTASDSESSQDHKRYRDYASRGRRNRSYSLDSDKGSPTPSRSRRDRSSRRKRSRDASSYRFDHRRDYFEYRRDYERGTRYRRSSSLDRALDFLSKSSSHRRGSSSPRETDYYRSDYRRDRHSSRRSRSRRSHSSDRSTSSDRSRRSTSSDRSRRSASLGRYRGSRGSSRRDRDSSLSDRDSSISDRDSWRRDRDSPKRDRGSLRRDRGLPRGDINSPRMDRHFPRRDRHSPRRNRHSPRRDEHSSRSSRYHRSDSLERYRGSPGRSRYSRDRGSQRDSRHYSSNSKRASRSTSLESKSQLVDRFGRDIRPKDSSKSKSRRLDLSGNQEKAEVSCKDSPSAPTADQTSVSDKKGNPNNAISDQTTLFVVDGSLEIPDHGNTPNETQDSSSRADAPTPPPDKLQKILSVLNDLESLNASKSGTGRESPTDLRHELVKGALTSDISINTTSSVVAASSIIIDENEDIDKKKIWLDSNHNPSPIPTIAIAVNEALHKGNKGEKILTASLLKDKIGTEKQSEKRKREEELNAEHKRIRTSDIESMQAKSSAKPSKQVKDKTTVKRRFTEKLDSSQHEVRNKQGHFSSSCNKSVTPWLQLSVHSPMPKFKAGRSNGLEETNKAAKPTEGTNNKEDIEKGKDNKPCVSLNWYDEEELQKFDSNGTSFAHFSKKEAGSGGMEGGITNGDGKENSSFGNSNATVNDAKSQKWGQGLVGAHEEIANEERTVKDDIEVVDMEICTDSQAETDTEVLAQDILEDTPPLPPDPASLDTSNQSLEGSDYDSEIAPIFSPSNIMQDLMSWSQTQALLISKTFSPPHDATEQGSSDPSVSAHASDKGGQIHTGTEEQAEKQKNGNILVPHHPVHSSSSASLASSNVANNNVAKLKNADEGTASDKCPVLLNRKPFIENVSPKQKQAATVRPSEQKSRNDACQRNVAKLKEPYVVKPKEQFVGVYSEKHTADDRNEPQSKPLHNLQARGIGRGRPLLRNYNQPTRSRSANELNRKPLPKLDIPRSANVSSSGNTSYMPSLMSPVARHQPGRISPISYDSDNDTTTAVTSNGHGKMVPTRRNVRAIKPPVSQTVYNAPPTAARNVHAGTSPIRRDVHDASPAPVNVRCVKPSMQQNTNGREPPTIRNFDSRVSPTRHIVFDKLAPTRPSVHDRVSLKRASMYDRMSPTRHMISDTASPTRDSAHDRGSLAHRRIHDIVSPAQDSAYDRVSPVDHKIQQQEAQARRSVYDRLSPPRPSVYDRISPTPLLRSTRSPNPPDVPDEISQFDKPAYNHGADQVRRIPRGDGFQIDIPSEESVTRALSEPRKKHITKRDGFERLGYRREVQRYDVDREDIRDARDRFRDAYDGDDIEHYDMDRRSHGQYDDKIRRRPRYEYHEDDESVLDRGTSYDRRHHRNDIFDDRDHDAIEYRRDDINIDIDPRCNDIDRRRHEMTQYSKDTIYERREYSDGKQYEKPRVKYFRKHRKDDIYYRHRDDRRDEDFDRGNDFVEHDAWDVRGRRSDEYATRSPACGYLEQGRETDDSPRKYSKQYERLEDRPSPLPLISISNRDSGELPYRDRETRYDVPSQFRELYGPMRRERDARDSLHDRSSGLGRRDPMDDTLDDFFGGLLDDGEQRIRHALRKRPPRGR